MYKIPGFRSGKTWKKIVASIGYLMIFSVIVSAFNGNDNKTSPTISPVQQEQQKIDENKSSGQDITKEMTQTPSEITPSASAPTTDPETNSNSTQSNAPTPSTDPVVKTESVQKQTNQDITVYVTKTGEKYHVDGCRSLAKSKIPISLDNAKNRGYEPCSVCNPPQ